MRPCNLKKEYSIELGRLLMELEAEHMTREPHEHTESAALRRSTFLLLKLLIVIIIAAAGATLTDL